MKNILFVCNQNQHRSPTAERIFKNNKNVEVKSAGLYEGSKILLDNKIIDWADVIIVMEEDQREEIEQRFPQNRKRIIVIDIPDVFNYMDKELVKILKQRMAQFFS